MDTLHERLADLADEAPTGGAPAAELWARGKRAHRLRAAAVAATVLVVGAVGTGIGVRLAEGSDNTAGPEPAGTLGISLPIKYPGGGDLPDLGDTPGPLAAIWEDRVGGGAPEAVGLVAETGTFGTLPIDVSYMNEDHERPALSPDGRRIAYASPSGEPIVHDLVSGEIYYWPEVECPGDVNQCYRWGTGGYTWFDATHLFGHAGAGDTDGYVWEPGTTPKLVNLLTYAGTTYRGLYAGRDLSVIDEGGGPRSCAVGEPFDDRVGGSPVLSATLGTDYQGDDELFDVPVLCDVLGVIGSEILLGHWNSDRLPGDWNDPDDGNGTVVALDIHKVAPPVSCTTDFSRICPDLSFEDPALRRVVVAAGAPQWVTFASDLIGAALDAEGGAS
ncbi:MAG: hypothetical protein WB471_10350 [Nocardioides sp.]